jgi:hypothetical protein
MAADPPLTQLALAAASVADDLGFVALADLRTALGDEAEDYRIIGGHMITVLAARWQLGGRGPVPGDRRRRPRGPAGRRPRL